MGYSVKKILKNKNMILPTDKNIASAYASSMLRAITAKPDWETTENVLETVNFLLSSYDNNAPVVDATHRELLGLQASVKRTMSMNLPLDIDDEHLMSILDRLIVK